MTKLHSQTYHQFIVSCSDKWTRDRAEEFVRGTTYEHAALIVARRIGGRNAIAHRVTGVDGLSGYFQTFKPCKTGGLTSFGEQFHVWSEEITHI